MINEQYPTLHETLELCKEAHGRFNALDKSGRTPYYWHLVRVMLRMQTIDLELNQIALLHDVIEDTDLTLDSLKSLNYSDRVIEGVKWCSRNLHDVSFTQWMTNIGIYAPDDTIITKISDISDNFGFERMQGLKQLTYINKKNMNRPHTLSAKQNVLLRDKIDRKVNKKMRLTGEMGVYSRYYKGWNCMFNNDLNNRSYLIETVYTGDFCFLNQLKQLSYYLPKKELLEYLSLNNIHTWKLDGELKVIQDRTGQDYLAIVLDSKDITPYTDFLKTQIDSVYLENQAQRDGNSYHITVLNAMELNKVSRNFSHEQFKEICQQYINRKFDFFTYGIGNAKNNDNSTFFVICENEELNRFREMLNLPRKDLHITLGFDKKDVFNVSKARDSMIFNNSILWDNFVRQFYINNLKNSLQTDLTRKNKIRI